MNNKKTAFISEDFNYTILARGNDQRDHIEIYNTLINKAQFENENVQFEQNIIGKLKSYIHNKIKSFYDDLELQAQCTQEIDEFYNALFDGKIVTNDDTMRLYGAELLKIRHQTEEAFKANLKPMMNHPANTWAREN